jgi:hypothetical protein
MLRRREARWRVRPGPPLPGLGGNRAGAGRPGREHRRRPDRRRGNPADLAAQRSTQIRFTLPADAGPAELPRISGAVATRGRNVKISTNDPTRDLLALIWWATGRGAGRLDGLTVTRPARSTST